MEQTIIARSQHRLNYLRVDFFFLTLMCLFVLGLGFLATQAGPGLGPDSVSYISAAKNLKEGRGYVVDLAGPFDQDPQRPLYSWPPGYSIFVAGLIGAGLEPIDAARAVSILSLVGLVFAVFKMGHQIGGRTFAICATLLTITLMPIVRLATFALSEMTFTLFSVSAVACILIWSEHAEAGRKKWLFLAGLFTGISLLTRYVGIVWIVSGLIVIFVRHRFQLNNLLKDGTLFVALAILPVMPWMIRNKVDTGHFTGMDRSQGYHPTIVENLRELVRSLVKDLLPSIHLGLKGGVSQILQNPLWFALVILVLLVIVGWGLWFIPRNGRAGKFYFTITSRKAHWIPGLFIFAYTTLLLVSSSSSQFAMYDWPRYLAPIYPLIIILGLTLVKIIISSISDRGDVFGPRVMIIFTLLWVVPNLSQTLGFARAAANGQELTSVAWRNSRGIAYLENHLNPSDIVFSDKPFTIVLYLDRPARYLPYADDTNQVNGFWMENLEPSLAAYIIVFKGELGESDPFFRGRLNYGDIVAFDKQSDRLELVADFPDSAIFRMSG